MSAARDLSICNAEAGLERVEFGPQDARQLLAALGAPLGDLRYLFAPLGFVDLDRLGDVGRADRQAGQVERALGRNPTDRGLGRLAPALEPFHDPLEDAGVLAEAGPQEPAVIAAPEPV